MTRQINDNYDLQFRDPWEVLKDHGTVDHSLQYQQCQIVNTISQDYSRQHKNQVNPGWPISKGTRYFGYFFLAASQCKLMFTAHIFVDKSQWLRISTALRWTSEVNLTFTPTRICTVNMSLHWLAARKKYPKYRVSFLIDYSTASWFLHCLE